MKWQHKLCPAVIPTVLLPSVVLVQNQMPVMSCQMALVQLVAYNCAESVLVLLNCLQLYH